MLKKYWIYLLAVILITARITLSFELPVTQLASVLPVLVIFAPILPIVFSVFQESKKQNTQSFLILFKAGMKGGMALSLIYVIGIFVLFQFINPFEFEARKAYILEEQIQAAAGQENFDVNKIKENFDSIFTPFNYITFTLIGILIINLIYSILASIFGKYYSQKFHGIKS